MLTLASTLIQGDKVLLVANAFGYNIVITLSQVIYFGIAAIVGIIAESVVGWRLPFGIVGAILASLIGIWLLTNIIQVTIPGDITIADQPIPIFKALLGAIVVVAIWHMITYPAWSHRRRYYGGSRDY
jgi:uncharacterized membrane protein YeaQ/YmgE (transglycosylase-associated protein family)